MPVTLADRLWAKVVESDSCWEWTGYRNAKGYGAISTGTRGKMRAAHRVSWQLTHGPIPAGLWVLHACDNPPCVRPDHLFLGTAKDNYDDMHSKGRECPHVERVARGDAHYNARLTADDVRSIRSRTEPHHVLAAEFGVARNTIQDVRAGRTWRHVTSTLTT